MRVEDILIQIRSEEVRTVPRHRILAMLEAALWENTPLDKQDRHGMAETLRVVYGLDFYSVKHRNSLWIAGRDVEPLWEAIDRLTARLSLEGAIRILKEARKRARTNVTSVRTEIARILGAGGATYSPDMDRALNTIRLSAEQYVRARNLSENVRDRFVAELMAGIDGLLRAFRYRTEQAVPPREEPARSARSTSSSDEITSACDVLGIKAPPDMSLAKKAFRKLSKKYHPDASGTSTTRVDFERVVRAYETLVKSVDKEGDYGSTQKGR